MLRLGLDIGGTKIEAQLLDGQGVSLLRRRIATPTTGYGDFLAAITDLVREIRQAMDSAFTIGVGLPGQSTRRRVASRMPTVCFSTDKTSSKA